MHEHTEPSFFQKHTVLENNNLDSSNTVSGEEFFRFFERKRLKLFLAFASGLVGTLGNYHAVAYQLGKTRIDMEGSILVNLYAFGLTAMLEIAVVIFVLMNIRNLAIGSTVSAIMISLYANVSLLHDGLAVSELHTMLFARAHYAMSMVIGILIAVLPILILNYLMHLVMAQYNLELERKKNERR
jgi:hypothetical protein